MPTHQKHQKQKTRKPRRNGKPVKQKHLTPGQWFEKLVDVQARLRAPNGCPWDREQTHQSLGTYLIEEAYEVWKPSKAEMTPSLRRSWVIFSCRLSFIRRLPGKRADSPWPR